MKRVISILLVLTLLFSFASCQNKKTSVNLEEKVEVASSSNGIIYSLHLPKNWEATSVGALEAVAYSNEADAAAIHNQIEYLPFSLHIDHFIHSNSQIGTFDLDKDKVKDMYKSIFRGDTSKFRDHIVNHTNFFLNCYEMELSADKNFANHVDKNFIHDIEIEIKSGKHGKIAVATFTIEFMEKVYSGCWCVREDIPYMAIGFKNEESQISSADIAYAVLDDLKVEEHFIESGNSIIVNPSEEN